MELWELICWLSSFFSCAEYGKVERPIYDYEVLDYEVLDYEVLDDEEPEVERPHSIGLSYNIKDQWEIPRSSLECIIKMGYGQFGEVWLGLLNNTTPVIIKTLEPGSKHTKDFFTEVQIMKYIRHPKIINMYAMCSQVQPFCIVTELVLGNLLEYLQGRERILEFQKLMNIATQIASGMVFLESVKCIHRELGAVNVFLGTRNSVKIGNFALARLLEEGEYQAEDGERFPIRWTAPEACYYLRYTIKSDVWSFGILLTEIVTYGETPYPGMINSEVLHQVQHGYRIPAPLQCPQALYEIMKECWQTEPEKRPTFQTLKRNLDLFCT